MMIFDYFFKMFGQFGFYGPCIDGILIDVGLNYGPRWFILF